MGKIPDFTVIPKKYDEFNTLNVSSLRFLHGRGGKFPGFENVIIDWYSPFFYIRFFENNKDLEDKLIDFFFYEKKRNLLIHDRLSNSFTKYFHDEIELDNILINDFGLKFKLKFGQNQNIGFFPDMKVLKNWILENSQNFLDKKILNLFSYTCSLSVLSKYAGAREVHNVDSVSNVLNWGRENHKLNFSDISNIYFHKVDIMKSLNWISRKGPFDVVLCDPPSFQKGSFDFQKDYKKIVTKASSFLNSGGLFIACLNAPNVTTKYLQDLFESESEHFEFVSSMLATNEFEEINKELGLKICIFKKK